MQKTSLRNAQNEVFFFFCILFDKPLGRSCSLPCPLWLRLWPRSRAKSKTSLPATDRFLTRLNQNYLIFSALTKCSFTVLEKKCYFFLLCTKIKQNLRSTSPDASLDTPLTCMVRKVFSCVIVYRSCLQVIVYIFAFSVPKFLQRNLHALLGARIRIVQGWPKTLDHNFFLKRDNILKFLSFLYDNILRSCVKFY